jgi:hypothetical protein
MDCFSISQIRLKSMFLSKPCSLALPPDSPHRAVDPQYKGIKRFLLTLLLFYSKQSKSIRGANVVYDRITSQVDAPAIYDGKLPAYYRICLVFFHLMFVSQSSILLYSNANICTHFFISCIVG